MGEKYENAKQRSNGVPGMSISDPSENAKHISNGHLKGLRPLPPTPADSRIFGFFDFSENDDFWDFPVGFGVWEGLQSMGNGCGLQMDGFSAHFEPYGSIFNDFHDWHHLGSFSVV